MEAVSHMRRTLTFTRIESAFWPPRAYPGVAGYEGCSFTMKNGRMTPPL